MPDGCDVQFLHLQTGHDVTPLPHSSVVSTLPLLLSFDYSVFSTNFPADISANTTLGVGQCNHFLTVVNHNHLTFNFLPVKPCKHFGSRKIPILYGQIGACKH